MIDLLLEIAIGFMLITKIIVIDMKLNFSMKQKYIYDEKYKKITRYPVITDNVQEYINFC